MALLIPKNIASDTVIYQKFGYKLALWSLPIFVVLAIFIPPATVVVMVCIVQICFTYRIYKNVAHEVVDTGTGLTIKNGNVTADIAYQDILAVDYGYSFFLKNNAVTLTIRPHHQLGETVRFVSWADSCNYNREFRLNPIVQTPETQAWIHALKEKIKT